MATVIYFVGKEKKASYPKAHISNFSVVISNQYRVVRQRWTTTLIQLIPRVTWTISSYMSEQRSYKQVKTEREGSDFGLCKHAERKRKSALISKREDVLLILSCVFMFRHKKYIVQLQKPPCSKQKEP